MLHQIKAKQFYSDLDLYQQCLKYLQKIKEFKDFLRHLHDFPVLFKAYLIFKDFSRKPSKFKYFSSLCEPCSLKKSHICNTISLNMEFTITLCLLVEMQTVGTHIKTDILSGLIWF